MKKKEIIIIEEEQKGAFASFLQTIKQWDWKKYTFLITSFVVCFAAFLVGLKIISDMNPPRTWKFQAIDTMKYSRDLSREKLHDPKFAKEVDQQVEAIAKTGATHVAIATPYDEEFMPMTKLWVRAARRNDLKVWFRGNWSGWEGWFDYKRIDRQTHIEKTKKFVLSHPTLFEDGDVFTSCPECENGVEGGVHAAQIEEHRAFLIEEYRVTKKAFATINKDVKANYYSMNGTLAMAMMDRETTAALDGVVVIDHYVSSPEYLARDVKALAKKSGGKVVLGEFGAPIPDINGKMTPEEQAEWLKQALAKLATIPELEGVSYWVNMGGSTAIWEDDGKPREAVEIISQVFHGKIVK